MGDLRDFRCGRTLPRSGGSKRGWGDQVGWLGRRARSGFGRHGLIDEQGCVGPSDGLFACIANAATEQRGQSPPKGRRPLLWGAGTSSVNQRSSGWIGLLRLSRNSRLRRSLTGACPEADQKPRQHSSPIVSTCRLRSAKGLSEAVNKLRLCDWMLGGGTLHRRFIPADAAGGIRTDPQRPSTPHTLEGRSGPPSLEETGHVAIKHPTSVPGASLAGTRTGTCKDPCRQNLLGGRRESPR